ncbi:hypothetical protein BH11PSE14_BH11PSE14_20890 [soil metagenome]
MSDTRVRIALLGRAGKARDQLHRALGDAGASIVVEGDPADLDPAHVAGLSPTCYLVSLEPAIEQALDRFDELLAAPGVEVMFDDAETSAKLDGWDLNRWARHIASKLLGSDGLPPAPAGSPELAGPAVSGDDLADSIAVDAANPGNGFDLGADMGLDLDDSLDLGATGLKFSTDDAGIGDMDLSGSGDDLSDSIDFGDGNAAAGSLDLDIDDLTAQLESYVASGNGAADNGATAGGQPTFEIESIESVAVEGAVAAKPDFDFSNLALAPMEAAAAAVAAPGTDYMARADGMGLSLDPMPGESPAAAVAGGTGAVVVLAGMGGPDAVRQLLSSLPETLTVPVLLYQHLEVGKHERLVDQLAKISRLPVQLARDGASPEAGKVSLLPAAMTATVQGNALVFHPGALTQLIAALPPEDSMVIVLSGADPQLVPMILELGESGGIVLAQDPDVCFDAGAAETMQRQGASVYPALGLARQIAARWPN